MDESTTQRMTGIDPMFIYSDTPETPMEIAYACVFDPSTAPGGYSLKGAGAARRADPRRCPPSGAASCWCRWGSTTRGWVDDPDFDITNHLHRAAVPAPAGTAEFTAKVAEVMGRPLPRASRRGSST